MDIADLESRPVTGQTTGSEGVQPPLVRQLGQRVDLVHELGQLAGAEELLDRRDDRLDGDDVLRTHIALALEVHPLAGDPLHSGERGAQLCLEKLSDTPDTAVAEVVDIIDVGLAVEDLDQERHGMDYVNRLQDGDGCVHLVVLRSELLVELVASDLSKIVASLGEEHLGEVLLRPLHGDHLAWHEDGVDGSEVLLLRGLVLAIRRDLLLRLQRGEDHLAVQRVLALRVDDLDLGDALSDEHIDLMRMQDVSGTDELDLLSVLLDIDVLVAVAVLRLVPALLVQSDPLALVEGGDDLLPRVDSDRTEE